MHERMLDRSTQPTDQEMLQVVGAPLAPAWLALRKFLTETYAITPLMNDGGKKYGWNLQYRALSRPLCELYPESGSFTALVILGRKELDAAMSKLASFGALVQRALVETPRYHDGCWMYIRVSDPATSRQDVADLCELVLIKKKKPPR